MGEKFDGVLALHDEVSNVFLFVQPDSGTIVRVQTQDLIGAMKESFTNIAAAAQVII